jgi:glycerol-3-phosphate acyltransferase PlsY
MTALFAFLGHIFPVFFGFKGGKGVATALGAFLALCPALAGMALVTWITVFAVTRISSLSALSAAALAPVYSWWLIDDVSTQATVLVMALLLIARHHGNIKRLLAGEEKKSG